jgi:hypothetical protein
VYWDPAMFYARFDTSLRPLLAMGAAFLPALSDTVDVSKLPSAEIVARHLGPTVMSQSYRGDGYVSESVGSVPLYPTLIAAVTAAAIFQHQTNPETTRTKTVIPLTPPSISSSPSGSPR